MVEQFIANDCELTPQRRLLIITGPNMGGKSTYMRQAALIAILAWCGSFVPASSCEVGPIDRIFTRIGASDDLAGGRSTFMVEMTEAAVIVNAATERSLVLVDEIGRGTSTFDGLSLAHAIARYLLVQRRCLTLFATHYFETHPSWPATRMPASTCTCRPPSTTDASSSCTRSTPARPARATACRWPNWPDCRPACCATPSPSCRGWNRTRPTRARSSTSLQRKSRKTMKTAQT